MRHRALPLSCCAISGVVTIAGSYQTLLGQANYVDADHGTPPVISNIEAASDAWPRLRSTWASLHALLSHPTVFLSEAWVDCWLSVFGADSRALLWTARAGDTVVAMAMLVRRVEWKGPVPVRCLYVNTAGEGADSVTLEHNTLLVRPGFEEAAWNAFAEALRRLPWDQLILVGGVQAMADRFRSLNPTWTAHMIGRPAPYVLLSAVRAQPHGLLPLLSANTRSQVRRAARVAGSDANLVLHEATTEEARVEIWRELHRLHTARWQERGEAGAFSRPRWRAFHERLQLAVPHATRLLHLNSGDAVIAVVYLLQCGGHVAFYQSGVRPPTNDNRSKPGLLLHAMVADRLADEGADEYDFLASDEREVRYKRSLAPEERLLWWGIVKRPTWRNRVAGALRSLRRRLAGRDAR